MIERVRRGQLDGIISGGIACETIAPSLRVVRIPGLLQTWAETSYVLGRLRPQLEEETRKNGFTYIGEAIIGPSIIFSRTPVRTLADLRHTRLWVWDSIACSAPCCPRWASRPCRCRSTRRRAPTRDGRVDGFIAPPAVALAFQWSAATRYFTDCSSASSSAAWSSPTAPSTRCRCRRSRALRVASARAKARFEEVGRTQEDQLMHGLFERQGLTAGRTSTRPRASAFFEGPAPPASARRRGWCRAALIVRVLGMLADYPHEHRVAPRLAAARRART